MLKPNRPASRSEGGQTDRAGRDAPLFNNRADHGDAYSAAGAHRQQTGGDCAPVLLRPCIRIGHDPVDDAEEKTPEGPALEPCGTHRDAARTRRDLERATCASISASRPLVRSPRQLPMGGPARVRYDGQPGGNAAPPFQRRTGFGVYNGRGCSSFGHERLRISGGALAQRPRRHQSMQI
jgi:hypothetical protein